MSEVKSIQDSIQEVRYNPAAIQRKVLDLLEDGIDVVDPSNPFIFLLEASAIQASSSMVHNEVLTRKLYPSMAVTEDELYLHMSDRDYLDRFSTPSKTTFTLLFEKEELKKSVIDTEVEGVKKLVIPKDSEFSVGDYIFTMQYPIEMRVMDYGGIQVVYDNSQPSPIETLKSNIVDWDFVKIDENEFVRIKIPVSQFKIETKYNQISKSAPFSVEYDFEDNFYFSRVYYNNGDGRWRETKTTHTDQVFDPLKPTSILKVYEDSLKVTIPQVYIDSGLIEGTVRIDIFTTKGKLNLLLDNFQVNAFIAKWIDRDMGENVSKFTTPLNTYSSMAVFSDAAVSGGSAGLSFEQLRERVLNNALGNSQLPITQNQLDSKLENKGYEGIKIIDNITDRIYLAVKKLPPPISGYLSSAAGSTVATLQVTDNQLASYPKVNANGERVTLLSGGLFKIVNGILEMVPQYEISNLVQKNTKDFLSEVNNTRYLVNPFHYVLDNTKKYFNTRAYYLDDPAFERKEFVEENIDLGLYISTKECSVDKTASGYLIQITTKCGDLVKEIDPDRIMPILSFKPNYQNSEVFLEGDLAFKTEDDEYVYNFFLNTDFDLDEEHSLFFTNFKMYGNDTLDYACDLTNTFDLIYYLKDAGERLSTLSFRPNNYLINAVTYGLSHEKLTFTFGKHLDGFWQRQRILLDEADYLTYQNDVYAEYTENVYERDPVTGSIILNRDANGELSYNLIHSKGDLVYDEYGNPIVRHRKGDLVLDSDNKPIIENTGEILKELDLFLLDGKFGFSTYSEDLNYLQEIPKTIVGWLENDIEQFRDSMLEQTELFFRPQKTYGTSNFLILESEERLLDLEQSFVVTFYLNSVNYSNEYLRESLREQSINIINEELQKNKVKVNEIISKLTSSVSGDIVSLSVEGLGGELNLPAISIIDKGDRCSIKKKLIQEMDGTFKVVDDVEVLFVRHQD